jgi:hypothetical protein
MVNGCVMTQCSLDRADDLQSSGGSETWLLQDGNGHNLVTFFPHFLGELKDIHCGEATNHLEDHFLSVEAQL